SGCQISEWLQATCYVHVNGERRMLENGTPDVKFMFVRLADCEIVDTWNAVGLRGTGSHDVIAKDLFVPAHHASFFHDAQALPDPKYRFSSTARSAAGIGIVALGIARSAVDFVAEIGSTKRPERSGALLGED